MSETRKLTSGTKGTKIKDFPNYKITEEGKIWSSYFKKWMKPFENVMKHRSNKQYYLRIALMNKHGERKKVMVHRLVAMTFVSNPHNKPFVNHIDGNKHNNNFRNLEWVSNRENCRHASKNNLIKKKLTDGQVKEIRKKYTQWSHKKIAEHFGVSRRLIGMIRQKQRRVLVE